MWVDLSAERYVRVFEGAVIVIEFLEEFAAALNFFRGDIELFADALFDVVPVHGERTEVVTFAALFVEVVARRERALGEF